jgi:hypothetical protein
MGSREATKDDGYACRMAELAEDILSFKETKFEKPR